MRYNEKASTWSALSLVLLGAAAGCAGDGTEAGFDERAETVKAPPPPMSELVDWQNAALIPSTDPASQYMRAQSLMVKLATNAYESDDGFQRQAVPVGFMALKSVHHQSGGLGVGNTDAVWGSTLHGKMGFIAIRGSSTRGDYLTDLFNAPTAPPDLGGPHKGTIHKGFYEYANKVYDELRADLIQVCPNTNAGSPQLPLWITGHSLGGAVANILAERLLKDGCNVRGVVTVGSPKPGLGDYKDAYNSSTLTDRVTKLRDVSARWVYGQDPIPCLAPGAAWQHVGRHNMVNQAGNVVVDADRDACETPDGTLAIFQTALDPTWFIDANPKAQAVKEWLSGRIVLEFLCNGSDWSNYASLGLCKVVEVGTRLVDAYGAVITPADLINAGIDVALNKGDHETENYVAFIPGDFTLPVSATARTTIRLPRSDDSPPLVKDAVSGDYCRAEPDPNGADWVCSFDAAVGSRAEYHITVAQADYVNLSDSGCTGGSFWKSRFELVCTVDSSIGGSIYFIPAI